MSDLHADLSSATAWRPNYCLKHMVFKEHFNLSDKETVHEMCKWHVAVLIFILHANSATTLYTNLLHSSVRSWHMLAECWHSENNAKVPDPWEICKNISNVDSFSWTLIFPALTTLLTISSSIWNLHIPNLFTEGCLVAFYRGRKIAKVPEEILPLPSTE